MRNIFDVDNRYNSRLSFTTYLFSNAIFWFALFTVETFKYSILIQFTSSNVFYDGICSVLIGFLLTLPFRFIAGKLNWLNDLSTIKDLYLKIIIVSIVYSILFAKINIVLDRHFGAISKDIENNRWLLNITSFIFWGKYMIIWTLGYYCSNYFARFRQEEVDKIISEMKLLKENLHNMELENRLLQMEQETAKALHSRMDTHLLFNILATIRATIFDDRKVAFEMITNFSEWMRFALDQKDLVLLEKELDILDKYIYIEEKRFEHKLKFIKNSESFNALDLEKILIPPLILQTLIENAIKHGIRNTKEGGTITFSCIVSNSYVIFNIQNPGKFNEENIKPNHGIDMARIRLSYFYPNNTASINITNIEENLVLTQFKIPI